MEISIAEHTSRMGLEDAFSRALAPLLAQCKHPAKALRQCRWTYPTQAELEAMPPEECAVAMVPVVSVVVSNLTGKLHLSRDVQAELVAVGCAVVATLPRRLRNERLAPIANIRNWIWKGIYQAASKRLDDLKQPQVNWGRIAGDDNPFISYLQCEGVHDSGDGDTPLNGQWLDEALPRDERPSILSRKQHDPPFDRWDGIYPALRSLFDCCQDDIDRAIIKARWADGRCVTEGYVCPIQLITQQLALAEPDVLERLHRLCNRWRCYINRTQRLTKHLPALPIRHHIST